MDIKTLDQIKEQYYGAVGTAKRDKLENELEALRVGLEIRNARQARNLTQDELAGRLHKTRGFVSRIENDSENITLKVLYDIVVRGLGGKLRIQMDFADA